LLGSGQPVFGRTFWGDRDASSVDGTVVIPARDAIVVQLV
jgi:hypothetical protein